MNHHEPLTPWHNPIVELDALALSWAIHARELSCREVMLACLVQIESFNPEVNALVLLRDSEDWLAQADERDRQLDRGQSMGWMHGMPQAIKDLAFTEGLTTSLGSPLFAQQVPQVDAISVARVRASGAIIVGKSNVPEFGLGSHTYNQLLGTTFNAYDSGLCAGGSSGGAAVALALRMLPVADGSDMMGSLRNPAAFNNVFGMRPSLGRGPFGPTPELFVQQLATEGPMGRTVADVARLLRTQAGYDPQVPLSLKDDPVFLRAPLQRDVQGLRLGWLGDYNGYLAMEDGVLSLCERALADFISLGCEVENCQPEFSLAQLWDCWLVHRHWLVQGTLGPLYNDPDKRRWLKPEACWEVEGAASLRAVDVYRASQSRSDGYRALLRLFERYDFLLLPTAQVFPFDARQPWPKPINGQEMDTYHRWMEVVIGPTLAGLPSISIPVGFNPSGLPMGLQIIGPAQADHAVLPLACAHEQLTQWVRQHPPSNLL
ncbi:amidase [Pseudomonas sp. LD120]|uniref:amidase n=1 Tax=Pseudomonas sp. LD120 TaxID=485751 RepID=UPI00135A3F90|nr:amidase [Pseudomonas sp. LD120]KAF0864700.1 amidase [Pseudomonas sp. LD120]